MLLSWSSQAAFDLFEAAAPLLYSLCNYENKWKKYHLPMTENCPYSVQDTNKFLLLCPKT